ncbi:MAG: A24 family peptidase [Propionibacteriales bacterium]|nr:A24 family peptidase [Propionibacteriales bacterium]
MTWLDDGHPLTGLVALLVGAVIGWFVPLLIAAVPEPAPEPVAEPDAGAAREGLPAAPPKPLYADLAARPGLALRSSLATSWVAGALAASVGPAPALLVLLPLVPIGVALAVIDWHTTLLPTKIIAPAYALVVACILVAGLLDGSREPVVRAAIGWAVMGGFFVLLWLIYPRGLGYGDVRLSGVLGLALGYVGWAALVTGMYGAFLIGGLGGALLGSLKIVNRKRFPFGPFMLVAAVLGIVLGPAIVSALGY